MPLLIRENDSMTVERGRKAKGLQNIHSAMAPASANQLPAVILHTARGTVKGNLTAKISKLTNRHQVHGQAWDM